LGAEERKEILAHLEGCTDCREAFQRWERIAGTFFRPPEKPSRAETEFFVQKAMERLDSEESLANAGWRLWAENRLMLPVLGLGLAAVLLSILIVRPESVATPDALLLVDAQFHGVGELVLPPDPSKTGMLMLASEEE
jgi:anti-sigma factor RsiW